MLPCVVYSRLPIADACLSAQAALRSISFRRNVGYVLEASVQVTQGVAANMVAFYSVGACAIVPWWFAVLSLLLYLWVEDVWKPQEA